MWAEGLQLVSHFGAAWPLISKPALQETRPGRLQVTESRTALYVSKFFPESNAML